MGAIVRNIMLVTFVWLMLAGVCLGKQVYLADGASIECESFWRRGDQIMVKVNRDILIDFDQSEVDVQRTFRKPAKKSHPGGAKKAAGTAGVATPVNAAAAAVAPMPPAATAATATTGAKPAPAPAATPVAVTQNQAPPVAAAPAAQPVMVEAERQGQEAAARLVDAQRGLPGKAFGTGFLLLILAVSLLVVVSMWVVFTRAGEAGWKSLVPIYNMYILMVIAGKPGWWLILLFVPIVGTVIYLMAMLSLAERFGRGALFGVGLFFLPMLFFPVLAFGGSAAEG